VTEATIIKAKMRGEEILDDELLPEGLRRRKLLPTWIKIFLWIFMVFGIVAPIGLVLGFLGVDFNIALYGLETTKALSAVGLTIITLLAVKGAVSFGLWTEKDWAVKLAIADAVVGIVLCVLVMLVPLFLADNAGFNFRLELIVLILYLFKMQKIKTDWENTKAIKMY